MDEKKAVRFSTALSQPETEAHVMGILVESGYIPQSRYMGMAELQESRPHADGEVILVDNEFVPRDSQMRSDLSRRYALVIDIAEKLPDKGFLLHQFQELAWKEGGGFSGKLPPLGVKSAKIILIGSPSPGAGVSTIAHNLAIEIAALSKKVLLVDADQRFPSLSSLMDIHDLYNNGEGRRVNAQLRAIDLSGSDTEKFYRSISLEVERNDYIIIDCGSIQPLSSMLRDRRSESTILLWLIASADKLLIASTPRELDCQRLDAFIKDFRGSSFTTQCRIIRNMSAARASKTDSAEYAHFDIVQTRIPMDPRNILKAEGARRSLRELQLRSPLRTAFTELAGDLVR